MCVCVCVCVCVSAYAYVYIYIIFIHICICILYIYMYIHVFLYDPSIFMCIVEHTNMSLSIYIYVHKYMHRRLFPKMDNGSCTVYKPRANTSQAVLKFYTPKATAVSASVGSSLMLSY